jgi:HrpA-like RNA helicase
VKNDTISYMDFSKIEIVKNLPIAQYEEEITQKFEASANLIIIGETGSGKTTQIPLIIAKSLGKIQDLQKGKIAITQPRRVAATSVSAYVASLMGEELGKTVGYKIRFSEVTSDESKIIFMTDGIMLREAQLDPLLMQYSVVMVDEAHERNINSDFLIGLLVEVQRKRKEMGVIPLKILVTSATLEKDKFEDFFSKIPDETVGIIEVPGRLFPITSFYERREVYDYEEKAAEKVIQICQWSEGKKKGETGRMKLESRKIGKVKLETGNEQIEVDADNSQIGKLANSNGDILIFMPGKREIEQTKEAIEELNAYEHYPLEIITIHANLPIEEQNKIFKKSENRKVVIATNIAETSLTVPGIVYVIDSGLIKQMEYNPQTGIKSLVTHHHSRKGLEQRKGRAGRMEPGFYYALFTEDSLRDREEFTIPEILRTSLTQVALIMKKIGIDDIEGFKFIDQPDTHFLHTAIKELQQYGALDMDEKITVKGETMAHLPLDPKLSNLVIEAQKNHCIESICTICAFLELKPVILNYTIDDFVRKIEEGEIERDPEMEAYDQAAKLFKDYKHKVEGLEYTESDFFTILKIWKQWIKAGKNEEWAKANYLSAETLEEATNIRDELLEIAEKNGYAPEDQIGKDLEYRIERTIIAAFKYNILFKQKSGFYKRMFSEESGIRIHNASVLLESKPYYAVAYEVIEINEIDAAPKLSAKFLHTIDDETLKRMFPLQARRMRGKEHDWKNKRRGRDKFRNNSFGKNKGRKRRR